MADQQEFNIKVGEFAEIDLKASLGSTGYGWELASLEGGVVNLVSMSVYSTDPRPGSPETQTFTFKGVIEGSVKAVFVLTAAWKVEEQKDQISYIFNVVKAEAADTDAFRLEGFTARPRAAIRSTLVPPYSIPARLYYGVLPPQAIYSAPIDPCSCVTGDEDCCGAQPKYGIRPPVIEYGVRPPVSSIQPLYAAPNDPCSCTTGYEECCSPPTVLKYNFPVMRYNIPPMMRYNFLASSVRIAYNFPDNGGRC